MTPADSPPVVLLSGRPGPAGATGGPPPWRGLGPTARLASLGATLAGAGAAVRFVADPDAHLPGEIHDALMRATAGAADAVVVVDADSLPAAIVDRLADGHRTVPVSSRATGRYRSAGDEDAVLDALGLPRTGGWRWVLPVPLLADCGLEVARDRWPALPADRVAAVVHAADRADQTGRTVRLVGLDLLAPDRATDLVATLQPRALRLDVPVAATHAVAVGAGLAGRRATLVLVVRDSEDAAALTGALDELRAVGVDARVEVPLTPGTDWADDVADAVVLAGVPLDWQPAPGVDWEDVALADATLARATGSPPGRETRRRARLAAFATLAGGRPAMIDRAGPAVVRSAGGPVEAAGCATVVFGAQDDSCPWGEHVELVEEPGAFRVDGLTVEALPYRHGRHVEPDGPTLLHLTGSEDVAAFLDDADRARSTGVFPRALVHPRTLLADACAWAGPGACPTRRVTRAVVGDHGEVRSAPHGIVVGSANDSHAALTRQARQELSRLEAERGCADCPVAARCSRDTCLRTLLSDADYCAARRRRPWLAAYTDAVAARQALAGQVHGTGGRVAGFGGWFAGHGDRWMPPDRPPAVLVAGAGPDAVFGFDPRTGRRFRLTADAAAVAECLFGTATTDDAVADVTTALAVDRSTAADAVARVVALLTSRGVAPATTDRPSRAQTTLEPVS